MTTANTMYNAKEREALSEFTNIYIPSKIIRLAKEYIEAIAEIRELLECKPTDNVVEAVRITVSEYLVTDRQLDEARAEIKRLRAKSPVLDSSTPNEEVERLILAALNGTEKTSTEIAKLIGSNRDKVKNAVSRMEFHGALVSRKDGIYRLWRATK